MKKKSIQKVRILVFIVALILLIINIISLNYNDLSWNTNSSHYLGIIAMFMISLSMLISYFEERKK